MLRTVVLLLVVTGIHGAPALADETSGHAQTQEENEHTPAGGASLEEIRVTAPSVFPRPMSIWSGLRRSCQKKS